MPDPAGVSDLSVNRIPSCAIIIPTYNGAALTATCLQTLLTNPPANCDWTILVVDDGSTDGTADALRRFGADVRIVELGVNVGFARACNAGAEAAGDCDYLVFLNNDTVPVAGWLDALVEEAATDGRVAAVGAKLLYPGGCVQHAGVTIGQDRWPHHLYAGFDGDHPAVNRAKDVAAATAACLLVRRTDFDELGGLDPAFHNGYEDIDLCLRLRRRGRVIRYCPRSVVFHLESVTRWPSGVPQGTEVNDRLYEERWRSKVVPDDLEHYLADGLLEVSYGAHYPVTLSVAPDLAVVRRNGEALSGVERILSERSKQVMGLISAQARSELNALRARGVASPGRPAGVERIANGREHQLGEHPPRHFISVVMPVKNGAHYLEDLLRAVLSQSISARIEIVAVDSGSEDGTIELLERFGATVLAIDPTEFDHGMTRNLVAENARGEYLVFLSQRSRPAGDRWLAPLIATLDNDPLVAGVCSRVVPHPDADVLTRRDVERDLSGSTRRRRAQIDDWSRFRAMSAEERRVFLNFHTVSAAIRSAAWRQTPFRSVRTIGEDLQWAREVVESGWAIVHEPASVVFHSHTYSVGELFARNVDDGIAGRDIVGRSLNQEQILPMIRAMVEDDWTYLRDTLGMTDPELERWQLEAVLRRAAQALGQWVGINHETFPGDVALRFSSVAQARGAKPPGRGETG